MIRRYGYPVAGTPRYSTPHLRQDRELITNGHKVGRLDQHAMLEYIGDRMVFVFLLEQLMKTPH